jgi:hypothetical protein
MVIKVTATILPRRNGRPATLSTRHDKLRLSRNAKPPMRTKCPHLSPPGIDRMKEKMWL